MLRRGFPFPYRTGTGVWNGITWETTGTINWTAYNSETDPTPIASGSYPFQIPPTGKVGAGTLYPVGMSRDTLAALVYRVRSWTVTNSYTYTYTEEGSDPVVSSDDTTATVYSGTFACVDAASAPQVETEIQGQILYGLSIAEGDVSDLFGIGVFNLIRSFADQTLGYDVLQWRSGIIDDPALVSVYPKMSFDLSFGDAPGGYVTPVLKVGDYFYPYLLTAFASSSLISTLVAQVNGVDDGRVFSLGGGRTVSFNNTTRTFSFSGTTTNHGFTGGGVPYTETLDNAVTIAPLKYWSYDGTYDVDTGVPL